MPEYKTARPHDPVTHEDMEVFMGSDAEPWVKALVVCLWVFGIRIGEARSRLRKDFSIQQGYLWLNAPPLKRTDEPRRVLPIRIDTPFLEYLLSYIRDLEPNKKIWGYSSVWCWVQLKRLDPTLCAHRFRHNRATMIALTRAHPYELQSWLGHSDIRMASLYIHSSGVFAEDLGKRLVIT